MVNFYPNIRFMCVKFIGICSQVCGKAMKKFNDKKNDLDRH